MLEVFEHFMKEKHLDLLILDNLMTLDIINISDENWQEKQQNRAETELMKKLKRLAEEYDCHVALVAHPRKISFKGLIRLTDVAGTANLGNLVDEAFIIHRVGQDFKNDAPLTFGIKADDPIFSASNIIEVAKDRDNGGQDKLVPLYFEKESRRFKNSETEKIISAYEKDAVPGVIIDAPLLFESGLDKRCDTVVAVLANREVRIARIMLRDGITLDAARARIDSQLTDTELADRANIVIRNDGTFDELKSAVRVAYEQIFEN
jgi:hypothetical protein